MKKYSVLMSVYFGDVPDYLRSSINSMLQQTHLPDQIVIVKDGPLSHDLNDVISEFSIKLPDIFTIVELEKNGGLGRALDQGIKYCRNELVARMDADDISLPERCERQVQCFEKDASLSIVGTYIHEFTENPTQLSTIRSVPCTHEEIVQFARRRSPFNHPTVMYNKSDVIRCGGYGTTKRKEDLSLFPAMVNNDCKAMNIPEVLLLYRSDKENLKRRKSFLNCKEYVMVIYDNYKKGYSKCIDLIVVAVVQFAFFVIPDVLARWISNNLLRRKSY